jgi:hypothetical protein
MFLWRVFFEKTDYQPAVSVVVYSPGFAEAKLHADDRTRRCRKIERVERYPIAAIDELRNSCGERHLAKLLTDDCLQRLIEDLKIAGGKYRAESIQVLIDEFGNELRRRRRLNPRPE